MCTPAGSGRRSPRSTRPARPPSSRRSKATLENFPSSGRFLKPFSPLARLTGERPVYRRIDMNTFVLAVLLSAFPAMAQDSEVDRLKRDMAKLKADYEAKINELNERLLKAESVQKKVVTVPQAYAQQLAEAEKKQVEMARDKALLAQKL